jgi:hypothetical protein
MSTIRHMTCYVCGEDAGTHEQHWNRDTGYGICPTCVQWEQSHGMSQDEVRDLYGIEGVNYSAPSYVTGRYGQIS